MISLDTIEEREASAGARFLAWLGRMFLAVIIPLIAFLVIYAGFRFLRDSEAPKWVIAVVAVIGLGCLVAIVVLVAVLAIIAVKRKHAASETTPVDQ